ncbi:hypothetical protein LOTGIDRAFT_230733 [Lottia gigantea]|uniref:EF-hand domain-containing protein n=1 Tax=Lottia gigantea TaxID=225164 RepID=V4AZE8_LOTGI|nr:hypothetical protein LOTGIDRAFT_230733 [Lottia gigantea]ESP00486.1 hypothetical protein LOTGIDRAFT_230733 [Lottia gigantea]
MKLVLILVAVVLVVNLEASWTFPPIPSIPPISIPSIPPIPRISIPSIPPISIPSIPSIPPIPPISIPSIPRIPWGKRNARQADDDAAFNAAAKDGVFSDDEIKSVFKVKDEGLADFYELYDVNGDEKITVEEYESVTTVLANAGDKEN